VFFTISFLASHKFSLVAIVDFKPTVCVHTVGAVTPEIPVELVTGIFCLTELVCCIAGTSFFFCLSNCRNHKSTMFL